MTSGNKTLKQRRGDSEKAASNPLNTLSSIKENFQGTRILKTSPDGSILRLKDVARVDFGSLSYGINLFAQGKPGTGIAIFQTAGSNANAILIAAEKVMKNAAANFPKGIAYFNLYSAKEFL